MSDTVIKEFLVSLGFKTDAASQQKFNDGLDFAQAKAVALGEAMYDLAKQVGEAMVSMVEDFDKLYWQTERLNSSATDIKAFGYAMSQLGGSAEGAGAMLERLAEFAKSSPGAQGFLRRLGVSPEDMGNAVAMAKDLEKTFQSMPYYRAKVFGQVLGIDPIQLQAMIRDQGQFEDQYSDMAKRLGIDLDEVTGKTNEFATRLREMKMEAGLAFDVALYKGLDWLLPKLEAVSRWIEEITSGKKLSGIGGQLQLLVKDIMALLNALGELASSSYMENFRTKFLNAIDNVINALTNVIKLINDVLSGNWRAAWQDAKNIGSGVAGAITNGVEGVLGLDDNWNYVGNKPRKNGGGRGGAANDDYYSGPGGATADSGTSKAKRAEDYFKRIGFSGAAAKGITAALWSESGLNEHRYNEAGSGAYGLGQWLTKSRVRAFEAMFHRSIYGSTFEQQLAFVAHELRQDHSSLHRRIKGSGSAMDVAAMFIDEFERPGAAGARGDKRRAAHYLGMSARGSGGSINQQTNIHVHGHDSKQIANDVAGHQDAVNQRLATNATTYAY